ncbi:MAG TPA: protoporphyrinogen oxidase [Bacteroidota bacterium]|nr:protoporphyrinogen oxidase [Bacteroidota bacterium]
MNPEPHVLVIGGGISGLTAAFWLRKAGVHVDVFEASDAAGGTMKTIREDGWLVETGPNSALETTPLFEEMFRDLGILGDRLYADPSSDNRYIVRDGALHVLPMKPGAFLTSKLWTRKAKIRLLKEPFIGRGSGEETVAAFVERRLGKEFLDYAINPFVSGVYAGDPAMLSVQSAFPKLYALERDYGGLVRGMIGGARARRKRAEKAKDRAKMFAMANGMQTFPDALARQLGDAFHRETEVTSLFLAGQRNGRHTFDFTLRQGTIAAQLRPDAVVLAVPASRAGDLVGSFAPALRSMLASIYYPPVSQVFLGYRASSFSRPLNGFGYLVPALERRSILGTIWSSSLFPHRAPAGFVALTSFVGGARQPELAGKNDDDLAAMTHSETVSLLGAADPPVYRKIIRWTHAIPQYNLGHTRIMEAIDRVESANPGLFFCANYRGGIAVGDCLMSGQRIAERVLKCLGMNAASAAESKGEHRILQANP